MTPVAVSLSEMPLRAAIAVAAERLASAGVSSPRHDAEELAAHLLQVSRGQLWQFAAVPADYDELVRRRESRVPLQHLTGRAYFRHVTLAVGPGVFIPRPETEVVAGAAIEEARRTVGESRRPVVVDLATGSAAIALSVATEVPDALVHAVELEPAAYDWAARNLRGTDVHLQRGDLATAFPDLDGTVDVVVSNPPYIPLGAVIRDAEVAAHDPAAALWSGEDGLDAVRAVERTAWRLLRPGGMVIVEHADVQGESAPAVFANSRWLDVIDHNDLTERPRYVTARRAVG